ncbi:GGDEF domain-containing protein [Actinomycetes bacterium KLBMP 9759]
MGEAGDQRGRNGATPAEVPPVLRIRPVRAWPVWTLPAHALVLVFVVHVAVLVLVAMATSGFAPRGGDFAEGVLLVALGLVHTEGFARAERPRRLRSAPHHVDLTSVWLFAAALAIPAPLAVVVGSIVRTHYWVRTSRPSVPCFKSLYSTSTMLLGTLASSYVASDLNGNVTFVRADLGPVALALVAFTTINASLVALAIALTTRCSTISDLVGHWDDNLLELAMLTVGVLVAAMLAFNPWLVLLLFPSLFLAHRALLVRHLEEVVSTDGKTGLLTASAWSAEAERGFRRGGSSRAVLVLDVDHFKAVNDAHGHLVGDRVLAAVADAVRNEVDDRDLVGRFGGEEFVVLLERCEDGESGAIAAAERIRRRVEGLRVRVPTAEAEHGVGNVTVSVGVALHPHHGADLQALLRSADAALYAAKRAGRNAVRISTRNH